MFSKTFSTAKEGYSPEQILTLKGHTKDREMYFFSFEAIIKHLH